MSLIAGSRLGSYEILCALGAGGMGEVYRARDTRLNRDVALKIMPDVFASDPERLARFEREAQVLASLNHPHIAQIYGVEEGPGDAGHPVRALVLEFIDGETLADRIARGPIPIDEALPIARQIAEALEAAHEQGIIHRDLKPANIKLRPDGTVKVLDFGLAKLAQPPAPPSNAASVSPTITSPVMMTSTGVLLGTAAYMSPEQARGRTVDHRADIWAFGCVLYEMLTGTVAFSPGETVSDAIVSVLSREPDWNALPSTTPVQILALLRDASEGGAQAADAHRCGSARPARRTLTRLTFDGAADDNPVWTPDGQRVVFRSTRGGADSIVWQRADGTGDAETLVPNSNGQLIPKAVSPDGSTLAFLYNNDLRQLSLKGRQGVTSLVATRFSENSADFSPDGKWIAYQSDESGRNEVYVRPFPDVDHGKWQVSTAGGSRPLWARGGGELFFLDSEGALMAASVRTTPVFAAEVPRRLVESGYYVGPGRPFDVSPDGERFLMIKEGDTGETAGPPQIIVVEHFDEELRRLAPAK